MCGTLAILVASLVIFVIIGAIKSGKSIFD